ncbi:hypothetical protein GEMRC1_002853 [Eukaryota sp. GEM-RC1]
MKANLFRFLAIGSLFLLCFLKAPGKKVSVFLSDDNECVDPMSREDPCNYVKTHCSDEDFFTSFGFSWLELHACFFHNKGLTLVSYPVLLVCTLLLFSLLGSTADGYLAVSLTELADILKLGPEVAGATLLAFANASPDVFSILAGSESDFRISMGAALGSSLFAVSLIISVVTFAVGEFKINKGPFMRDLLVYFVGVCLFAVFSINGELHLIEMIIVLVYFCAYIVYLILSEVLENIRLKKAGLLSSKSLKQIDVDTTELNYDLLAEEGRIADREIDEPDSFLSRVIKGLEWDEKERIHDKIMGILELPFALVRYLSIPMASEDAFLKPLALVTPFFSVMFVLWSAEINPFKTLILGVPLVYLVGLFALVLCIWVSISSKEGNPPKPFVLWLILGVTMAVAWLEFIADELVLLLSSISTIIGLSPTLIGLLVLSVGNGIGDLVANLVVAKKGNPVMATAAVFSSSLLSMNLGLSLSLIPRLIETYPTPYTFEIDGNIGLTFFFLIFCCVLTMVMMPLSKYRSTKLFAGLQLGAYVIFVALAILIGLNIWTPFWV